MAPRILRGCTDVQFYSSSRQTSTLVFWLKSKLFFARDSHGQADISSPQQAPNSHTRIPRAHGHQVGTPGTEPPPEEGPQDFDGAAAEQVRRRLTIAFALRASID